MTDQIPDAATQRAFNQGVIDEFRANNGKVGGPFAGQKLLLLTTQGAKSGLPRLVPLSYLTIDGAMILVGSLAGADVDPAWAHNLRAHPRAQVDLGTQSYDVLARELPRAERDATFPKVTAMEPIYADYQARTTRPIPLFELRPADN
ncbi:nitroreductase family deazaflavin-dependent oxidoreductase [Mycobacterium vicinigordonae]|uniref:Nitroreductase family deazaflavin-dependent oxidoreductase n=1 Tax=Mycobacterium vicinigordonae TaxID=1719132 RepID=A0A7D6DXJ2_9MYCO|nr:nitroreductase family deazaflavin-dependent oxidoreductase [Mycobacterium vicinigordonae]QLL06948.1 nitroreductase family deazaflavin-dependent oxidoreductase [Mycobacterium vicinigordonae]